LCLGPVASFDCQLNFFDKGTHTTNARDVDSRAPRGLANSFLRRFMVRHIDTFRELRRAGLYRLIQGWSTDSGVLEIGLSLLDEGRHALFLVLQGERRVKQAPLKSNALF